MSATAIVTSPAMTSPRSSTWSSVSSSDSSSSSSKIPNPSSAMLPFFIRGGEVVRGPRAGELEAEAERRVALRESFGRGAEHFKGFAPDEEREARGRLALLARLVLVYAQTRNAVAHRRELALDCRGG